MTRKSPPLRSGVQILRKRYYEGNPDRQKSLDDERLNAAIAREIYDLRKEAGLTQKQLAEMIETTQSAIARLEDSDYEGHSLRMLNRISDVLDYDIVIKLVPRNGHSGKVPHVVKASRRSVHAS